MLAPDLTPEQLARLWGLLMEGPDALARLLRRPRLARHPRRLRVACRSPLLIRGRGCRH